MNKVCIITTGQPSVNPRVVKEANILQAKGYDVTVLFCYWIQWASDTDALLLEKVTWTFKLVGGTPTKNKWLYYFTKIRFKINRQSNKIFGNKLLVAERAQARCYDELLQAAKSIKADWYIGHNLGTLPIVIKAAALHSAKAGFDFEDYHREENEQMPLFEQERNVYLEEKYIPSLDYISTSSPLITKKVKGNFPSFFGPLVTLLNCFPLSQQPPQVIKAPDNNTMQLFWFSQTVGKNRGLEIVVAALRNLNIKGISLTLAGRCDPEMQSYILDLAGDISNSIHFAGIIFPDDLPAFAAKFDVGIASETITPLNRNICLTNKIFTYLLAGNCILASDTDAQKDFLNYYNDLGLMYKHNDPIDLANKISDLYNNRNLLLRLKNNAYNISKTVLNWEKESSKLIEVLTKTF
ncbi:MAG: hypothetical protein JWQ09_5956 [Segetibacter sp.]|nr:hypothetical protein [Segetibacter sp.]